MQWPMLVTLTLPHSAESDGPADVRRLRRALGKLRRLRWFRLKVRGGITSVEVTCGENGWHPHAHMLIDCRWLSVQTPPPDKSMSRYCFKSTFRRARAEVAEQWGLCLGETVRLQVNISRARKDAAREVLKYAVKPQDLAEAPLPLAPLLRILSVSRLVSAFGSVRASRLAGLQGQLKEERSEYECSCGCRDFVPDFVANDNIGLDRALDRKSYRVWKEVI